MPQSQTRQNTFSTTDGISPAVTRNVLSGTSRGDPDASKDFSRTNLSNDPKTTRNDDEARFVSTNGVIDYENTQVAKPEEDQHHHVAGGLLAAGAATAAGAAAASHMHERDGEPQKDTLSVPGGRRGSNVSDVSSPSQGPDLSEEANRSISPALAGQFAQPHRPVDAPPAVPIPTESEALDKEDNLGRQEQQDVPTALEEPTNQANAGRRRVEPGAPIIPVADLSSQKGSEIPPDNNSRPFSFAGTNSLEPESRRALLKNGRNHDEDSLAKDVSIDDSTTAMEEPGRNSRSYSRPFSQTDPNVHEHPAFRVSPQLNQRATVKPASPLPSATRSQDQYGRMPAQHMPLHPPAQYKIPGPYKQEYRSPSHPPRTFVEQESPVASQPPQGDMYDQYRPEQQQQQPTYQNRTDNSPYAEANDLMQQAPQQQLRQQPQQQQETNLRPTSARQKSKGLGGFFGGSRFRQAEREHRQIEREAESGQNKRSSLLFKPRSRQDNASMNSQPSQISEGRDQVPEMMMGNTPGRGGEKRRKSKDLFRSSTSSSMQPEERQQKKRHSGLAGLFSRGSKYEAPARSSTSQGFYRDEGPQTPSEKRDKLGDLQQQFYDQQVSSPTRRGTGGSSGMQAGNQQYPNRPQGQEEFRGNPPPAGGYYGGTQTNGYPRDVKRQDEQYAPPPGPPRSYTGPPPLQTQSSSTSQSRYQRNDPTSPSYHKPPPFPPPNRPNDLRLDTDQQHPPLTAQYSNTTQQASAISSNQDGTNSRSLYSPIGPVSTTHSGPPVANQQPQQQPSFPIARAPLASSPPANSSATYAADLHKRSRSPRNGRRGSGPEDINNGDGLRPDDPVNQLGTFKNRSPTAGPGADGQQEKPWSITLPADNNAEDEGEGGVGRRRDLPRGDEQLSRREVDEGSVIAGLGGAGAGAGAVAAAATAHDSATVPEGADTDRANNTMANTNTGKFSDNERNSHALPSIVTAPAHLPTATAPDASTFTAPTSAPPPPPHTTHPQTSRALDSPPRHGKHFGVAELPGSKAAGYESDEEIPMSATAYPGQEWMPWASFGGNGDDLEGSESGMAGGGRGGGMVRGMPEAGHGRWDD